MRDFISGAKKGIPIALGYIPVSFTFGLIAVNGGIPVWIAILISMTNLTSAGQFAGTDLIIAGSSFVEIALTTFIINIRYMLMSLSLSQKVDQKMPVSKRSIMAFGITDEIFSIASMEEGEITFSYMMGLFSCPYWGWALGTALGALTCSVLPEALQNSMGIALYAMFIALVVPAAKKSKAAFVVAAIAISINSILTWMPGLNSISDGWSIIIATLISCTAGALLFPRKSEV
ncbi:MAG TPA: AzlC family ABC transporter permease [Clostridiales bacterium]|nr:AzlC family ABC transporter permease [Clostridiales bacterium]